MSPLINTGFITFIIKPESLKRVKRRAQNYSASMWSMIPLRVWKRLRSLLDLIRYRLWIWQQRMMFLSAWTFRSDLQSSHFIVLFIWFQVHPKVLRRRLSQGSGVGVVTRWTFLGNGLQQRHRECVRCTEPAQGSWVFADSEAVEVSQEHCHPGDLVELQSFIGDSARRFQIQTWSGENGKRL